MKLKFYLNYAHCPACYPNAELDAPLLKQVETIRNKQQPEKYGKMMLHCDKCDALFKIPFIELECEMIPATWLSLLSLRGLFGRHRLSEPARVRLGAPGRGSKLPG